MYLTCRHIMPNGSKCNSPALRSQPFCYFHSHVHRLKMQQLQSADEPAGALLEFPVLEDRCAMQLALSTVLNALGASRLDPRRAGLILYALQIASMNVERDQRILPADPVQTITYTEGGEEMGPEEEEKIDPSEVVMALKAKFLKAARSLPTTGTP